MRHVKASSRKIKLGTLYKECNNEKFGSTLWDTKCPERTKWLQLLMLVCTSCILILETSKNTSYCY